MSDIVVDGRIVGQDFVPPEWNPCDECGEDECVCPERAEERAVRGWDVRQLAEGAD